MDSDDCLHVSIRDQNNFVVPEEMPSVELEKAVPLIGESAAKPKVAILDLPIGWKSNSGTFRHNREFEVALEVLPNLAEEAIVLMTTSSAGLGRSSARQFRDQLQQNGFSITGYIELPDVSRSVGFRPLLAFLSKKEYKSLFLASLNGPLDEDIVGRIILERNEQIWTDHGFTTHNLDFRGFRVEKVRSELENLLKVERGFDLRRFGDFVVGTQVSRREEDKAIGENSIAVSRLLGNNFDIVLTRDDKPQAKREWIHVSLDEGLLPPYAKMFLNSKLGRMCLETATTGAVASVVAINNLLDVLIPVPSLETQKTLVETSLSLEKLQVQISRLERELVFNPRNIDAVSGDVIRLLDSVGRLTEADKIKSLVRSGENKTTEFKETLSWDIRKQQKAKYIEDSALKTVAGFLNTDGGVLLVGVSDAGEFPGLEFEIKKLHNDEPDRFLLHFKNLVKSKLGEKFYTKLDWSLETVDGQKVLLVKAQKGTEPAFLDDTFYVRTNPATDKLQGERLYKYLSERF